MSVPLSERLLDFPVLEQEKGSATSMNTSTVTEFVFLGLPHSRSIQLLLFLLVLACYMAILLGNLLIVVTVHAEPRLLQSPMYLFLGNLSIIDTAVGSVAVPKMLAELASYGKTISLGGCMTQIFFLHFFGGSEMLLLTLMAYDRYVAICHPLMYMTTMNRSHCRRLLVSCWVGGLIHSSTQLVLLLRLPFCGPNKLDNFYCDVPQVVKLACADVYVTEILMVANSGLLSLVCLFIVLVSYAVILATLRGYFRESGRKALSTYGSHLTVVNLVFVPCLFVYLVPSSSSNVDKMASIFYTIVTPALNPMIYTLRNREMREAMGRLKNQCIFSHFPAKGQK
ncbi:olfactory receptor 4Q3-like [Rhineura floridana]|uniref:olfactory receptor 4Q3-like n=1 Tax=Rhineura floridana TaxID=261503 RepID=UPI002AC845BE|nr:olfactory receptor 4Q3-like [Rhineura floridana]